METVGLRYVKTISKCTAKYLLTQYKDCSDAAENEPQFARLGQTWPTFAKHAIRGAGKVCDAGHRRRPRQEVREAHRLAGGRAGSEAVLGRMPQIFAKIVDFLERCVGWGFFSYHKMEHLLLRKKSAEFQQISPNF